MNKSIADSTPKKVHKVINISLIIINVLTAAMFPFFLLTYRQFFIVKDLKWSEMSPQYAITAFFLRPEFIIIPILLIIYMIVKEFKIKQFKKRMHINWYVLAGIYGHAAIIGFMPFICKLI